MTDEKRKKILIIEDDVPLQKILGERAGAIGIDVSDAATGKEGLNKLRLEKPDLVLLDIMLPGGMNGFDVLEKMKQSDELKNIPVIVLTNLDTEQKTALDIGAIDYVVKSNISIDEIVLKIRNHLQEK